MPAVPGSRPLSSMTLSFRRLRCGDIPADSSRKNTPFERVADDLVAAQEVVGVLVADRDAEPAVVLQAVALEHAVADAPAQEQAVGAVAPGDAVPHDGALRAAAGVEAEVGVVLADAVDDRHVVRLLEADPVAVVVPHDAAPDRSCRSRDRGRSPHRGSR